MHTSKTIKLQPVQQGQSLNVWIIRSPCPEVYEVGKGELHQRSVLYPILHAERAEQFANAVTQLAVENPRDTDTEPTEGGTQYERSLQSMEWQSHLILEKKKKHRERQQNYNIQGIMCKKFDFNEPLFDSFTCSINCLVLTPVSLKSRRRPPLSPSFTCWNPTDISTAEIKNKETLSARTSQCK